MNSSSSGDLGGNGNHITFQQIANFFLLNWKRLLIGSALGLLLGITFWGCFAGYKADLLLSNKLTTNTSNTSNASEFNSSLDFVSWQLLVKKLPTFAMKLEANSNAPGSYGNLTSAIWWSKNVVPMYVLSKVDLKELSSNPKILEASNLILAISITDTAPTAKTVQSNLLDAAHFIHIGGAYLAIEALLASYEMRINQESAQINSQILDTQIKVDDLLREIANLENLRKKFPQVAGLTMQISQLKVEDVKFLPITTQLVALNSTLLNAQENLITLRHSQDELVLLGQFLAKAKELSNNNFDGLKLFESLMAIESEIRRGLKKSSFFQERILAKIRLDLVEIESRYGIGLEVYTQGIPSRSGVGKFAVGGLLLGFLLAVASVFFELLWHRYLVSRLSIKR